MGADGGRDVGQELDGLRGRKHGHLAAAEEVRGGKEEAVGLFVVQGHVPAPACWNVSSTLPALRSHSAACWGWSRLLQPSSAWLVFGLIARPFGLHLSTTSVFETIVSDVGSNW